MTHFITEPPFPAAKRHKDSAKKHARESGLQYSKALDDLTSLNFPEAYKSTSWDEFQRYNTAELQPAGVVATRLTNDLPLEIQLAGFREDLSDFTEDAALTKMRVTASAFSGGHPDFRIVCKVGKSASPKSTDLPIAKFFDASKNSAPLRERLGPVVRSLRADVLQILSRWETWAPQAVRLHPTADDEHSSQAFEAQIVDVLRTHGLVQARWASKAALAANPHVPMAWLLLLKFGEKYPRDEFVRIVECGIAASDFAYGPDFNLPQVSDPGLITAVDTFLEIGQFAAALHDAMGNSSLAGIVREKNLDAVLSRNFPTALLKHSQVLKPIPRREAV